MSILFDVLICFGPKPDCALEEAFIYRVYHREHRERAAVEPPILKMLAARSRGASRERAWEAAVPLTVPSP